MSGSGFILVGKFNSLEDAEELKAFLKENSVQVELEDAAPSVDLTFSGNTLGNEIQVCVKKSDYNKANQLLEERASKDLKNIPKDYHLFQFSIDELKEIVEHPDEWSNIDYLLSLEILKERGIEFNKTELENFKKQRISESRKLDKAHPFWIVFGFISSVFGGIVGIWMGHYYWRSTNKDLTGKKYFAYNQKVRNTGLTMFLLGIVSLALWLFLPW